MARRLSQRFSHSWAPPPTAHRREAEYHQASGQVAAAVEQTGGERGTEREVEAVDAPAGDDAGGCEREGRPDAAGYRDPPRLQTAADAAAPPHHGLRHGQYPAKVALAISR